MTDDQLVDKLRTVVREEVEAETKKTERDSFFSNVRLGKLITDLKSSVKDLKISNSRLERGLDAVKTEQQSQGKTLNEHGKALKKLTTLANKTHKSVNLMAGNFDADIVINARRIDRIEDHLNLPAYKAKQ